jgi:hypothetical protein
VKKVRPRSCHDGAMWLGLVEGHPGCLTQGASIVELEETLREIYPKLASGVIPRAQRAARF